MSEKWNLSSFLISISFNIYMYTRVSIHTHGREMQSEMKKNGIFFKFNFIGSF